LDGSKINKVYTPIPLEVCTKDDLSWMAEETRSLLCPTKELKLSGLMNTSP
jgi:hypothetical protein